jgi:uncharacterized tellurite resistance protein B-like protein
MNDAEVMLRSLVSLAAMDGHTDDTEFAVLVRLCKEWRLPMSFLKQIVADVKLGNTKIKLPEDPALRMTLFGALLRVTLADGVVHDMERLILYRVGMRLDLDKEAVDNLIAGASAG